MARIAVDIDNTLYSFEQAARQAFLDIAVERDDKSLFKGAYNPWGEWRSMGDTCGPEVQAEVIERVHSSEVILSRTSYEEASETLADLRSAGHSILYISNRSEGSLPATSAWLFENEFPPGPLTCNLRDKVEQVTDCQYIIDDRPKTLVQFVYNYEWTATYMSGHGGRRIGFGLSFPFNQALTDIPDVYLAPTWAGIRYYLEDQGVL